MTTRLDISIGPVQGFVSQSRRTRDLWGSSYLLAFLSAHAMHGADKAGGRIMQPAVDDDPLYRWVAGHRAGDPPRFGTLPNHFVVEVDGDARRVAEAAIGSLTAAWERVHEAVRKRFVAHACSAGNATEAIWNRQVGGFWEVMWTAAPSHDRGGSFSRCKHWRSHRGPDEPGDKCTVMHDLQELSGHVRAQNRSAQDQFWKRVHDRHRSSGSPGQRTAVRHRARETTVAEGRAQGAGLGRGCLAMAFDGVCRCCALDAADRCPPCPGRRRSTRRP